MEAAEPSGPTSSPRRRWPLGAGRAGEVDGSRGRPSLFTRVDAAVHRFLIGRSLVLLRWSVGAIFVYFGALKFVPGWSPAESLVMQTFKTITFDVVPGRLAVVFTGAVECVLGVLLLSGWLRRMTIYVLGLELIGILAPLALFPSRLFTSPLKPTLEGQYVLKDLILAASAMVLASTIRGGRLVSGSREAEDPSAPAASAVTAVDDRTRVVLASIRSAHSSTEAARAHGITPQEFRRWRDDFLDLAVANIALPGSHEPSAEPAPEPFRAHPDAAGRSHG